MRRTNAKILKKRDLFEWYVSFIALLLFLLKLEFNHVFKDCYGQVFLSEEVMSDYSVLFQLL